MLLSNWKTSMLLKKKRNLVHDKLRVFGKARPMLHLQTLFSNEQTLNNVAFLLVVHYDLPVLSAPTCAVSSADQQGSVEAEKVLSASPMMQVEGFFMALTNSNADGRVVVHRQGIFLKNRREKNRTTKNTSVRV